MRSYSCLEIRPYQLLCLLCRSGGNPAADSRLEEIAAVIWRNPCLPLRLRCNVSSLYRFQNPGHRDDTPEGAAFNAKRDLDILRRLGLVPGDARPAWELVRRVMEFIPDNAGICGYGTVTAPAWTGCPHAESGYYARGVAKGIGALLTQRTAPEMARVKAVTARALETVERLEIRPHHLLCMACFHGGRAEITPIAEDNLAEAVAAVQRNPAIPVTLVQGCCNICPPCPQYDPGTGLCIRSNAMGLRDEKKDLDLLQRLGLQYGDTLPARELYARLFAEIRSTTEICGAGDGIARGWEWTACGGPGGNEGYVRARAVAMDIPGLSPPEA